MQFARPKKQLIDAEDDEPTYLDEHGRETISKEEFEQMTSGEVDDEPKVSRGLPDEQDQLHGSTVSERDSSGSPKLLKPSKEPQTTFGSSKKRKAVKVTGDDDVAKDSEAEAVSQTAEPNNEVKSGAGKKLKPKKAKKVKLSFDED